MRHFAAVAALLLIVAACGDSSGDTTTTGPPDTAGDTSATTGAPATATATTGAPEAAATTVTTGPPPPPITSIGSATDAPNDLADSAGSPVADGPAHFDMLRLRHTEQGGVHTVAIELADDIEQAGTALVEVRLTGTDGTASSWTITYEGEGRTRLRPHQEGPNPTVILSGTSLLVIFDGFEEAIPSGSTLDVTLGDEGMTTLDDIEYQAP